MHAAAQWSHTAPAVPPASRRACDQPGGVSRPEGRPVQHTWRSGRARRGEHGEGHRLRHWPALRSPHLLSANRSGDQRRSQARSSQEGRADTQGSGRRRGHAQHSQPVGHLPQPRLPEDPGDRRPGAPRVPVGGEEVPRAGLRCHQLLPRLPRSDGAQKDSPRVAPLPGGAASQTLGNSRLLSKAKASGQPARQQENMGLHMATMFAPVRLAIPCGGAGGLALGTPPRLNPTMAAPLPTIAGRHRWPTS